MSKCLIGISEIVQYVPWSEETLRRKYLPKMIESKAVFWSLVGRGHRKTYWTTVSLLERFLQRAAEEDGRI